MRRCALALAGAVLGCAPDASAQPQEHGPPDCSDPTALAAVEDPLALFTMPSFGEVNEAQVLRMAEAEQDGPFYVVNLTEYREQAMYADGRDTSLTGREATQLFAPVEFLAEVGARPIFAGTVDQNLITDGVQWDTVGIVEYPCRAAFFHMIAGEAFRERVVHEDAGVGRSTLMVADLRPSALPEDFAPASPPFPPTADDPSFEMIHVVRFNEVADYGPGSSEPPRSGEEAVGLYATAASAAAARLGVYPTAWFAVEGALVGDGRAWDEVRLNHMPSRAAFEELVVDPQRAGAQFHRDAGIADTYSLITLPDFSELPGAPAGDE